MKKLIIVLLISIFAFQIKAQNLDSISNKLTTELNEIYDRGYINGFSVAIVNQDKNLYNKGFGFSDLKGNKPYTENTIQNIASISKTFIGIALLKAQELGKLQLDDPINNYLPFQVINPYFPNEKITIRHLATHTSSITDPARYEKNGYILKEGNTPDAKPEKNFRPASDWMTLSLFLEKVLSEDGKWYAKRNFLNRKPGDLFEYSNIAAALAALIIEGATGQSFPEFTRTYIFEPLQMNDSGWSFEDVDFSKHTKLYKDPQQELAFYTLITYPDGGLITSSIDMGKYLSELIKGYSEKGSILQKESYKELFKQQLTARNFEDRNEDAFNDEYNSGIFMGFSAQGNVGHTGGDPGVATFMFFNSSTLVGKFLMVNTEMNQEGVDEFISIWKKLLEYENELE